MKIYQFRRIIPIIILTGGLLMTPVVALETLDQSADPANLTGNLEADRYLAVSDEEKAAWEALETEGPPPWATARQKDIEGWFEGDRIGPPPWAASHKNKNKTDQAIKAEQRQQWQESETEGPPPWAVSHQNKNKADQAIKAEQRQQWQESEKDGPPPWATASRKEIPDN